MFKKQEKDIVYDINYISSFNIVTKRAKNISYTWNQDLYTLQRPEIPKESYHAIGSIVNNLGKLGNPIRLLSLDPTLGDLATQGRFELPLIQKESTKEDHIRGQGGKLREIDIKLSKKNEESKKLKESVSFAHIKSRYNAEAVPIKIGIPATTRNYLKKQPNSKSTRILLPKIIKT